MSMKKLLILIFSLIITVSCFSVTAFCTEGYDISAPGYEPDICLLVNSDTDTVIYSKNADKITAPASLTKIVTSLVVLSKGDSLSKVIKCNKGAVDSILGTASSIAGLYGGEKTTLEMLLYCLYLPSANDAAAVLAYEYGKGDTAAFVAEMNSYVKKLGCKNTYFANPHGLDDEDVKGYGSKTQNHTTASDMYIIAKEALKNQTIVRISSKYGKTMPKTNKSDERYLYNTNSLLNNYSDYYYEGAIGLKTGTTDKAGACLITSAQKNGYNYIAIAMHGVTDYSADRALWNTAYLMCRYMLRWAFENTEMKILADTSHNMGEVGVEFGRGSDYVSLVPSDDISAVVAGDIDIDDMKIVYSKDFPKSVKAPVKAGQIIGKAKLVYKKIKVADVTLTASESIKKNYIWAMFSWLEKIVKSKVFIVIAVIAVLFVISMYSGTKKKRQKNKRRKNSINVISDFSNLK